MYIYEYTETKQTVITKRTKLETKNTKASGHKPNSRKDAVVKESTPTPAFATSRRQDAIARCTHWYVRPKTKFVFSISRGKLFSV